MNRNEAAYCLRSDEDDVDYLRDKLMGRCPWCDGAVFANKRYPLFTDHSRPRPDWRCGWNEDETELENRSRYQKEREESARVEDVPEYPDGYGSYGDMGD